MSLKSVKMNETKAQRETDKKHTCSQCGTAFSRPYRLKQHEKIHLNITEFECGEPNCNKSHSNKSHLDRHIPNVHKEFVCGEPNCNKSYSNKSHLDRHIQSVHIDRTYNVIYSCPECRKVFVNRQNLKRHIKVVHSRKAWFNCDVCSCSFKKKNQLSAHMYQHTFVKSFSCELCSGEFITITEKRKHMKQHKTYSCEFCDMAFVQWSKYWKHKKMVHTEFICDDCGRKFYKRVHMVRHTRIHNTRHTPTFYPCTYENCERVYTRNSNLKQHIKIKHLKIKHDCEICGAKLSTKAKLAVHLRTHSKQKKCKQPAGKSIRQVRCDKGASKVSTALRIAGLIWDPEDENIKGTLKATTGHVERRKIEEDGIIKRSLIGTTGQDELKNKEDENIKGNVKGSTEHVDLKIEDEKINGSLKAITVHIDPKIENMVISDIVNLSENMNCGLAPEHNENLVLQNTAVSCVEPCILGQ